MYVFFDIDGVLNKRSQWKQFYSLDAGCVDCFCGFLHRTGGVPIIMSSWRTGFLRSGSEKKFRTDTEIRKNAFRIRRADSGKDRKKWLQRTGNP